MKNFIASKDNTIKSNARKNLLEAKRNESIKNLLDKKRKNLQKFILI